LAQCQLNLKDEQLGIITIDNAFELSFMFHPGANPDQPEARLSWNAQPNGMRVDAWGWTNPLGESLLDPISIARNNTTNADISINFINFRIGALNHCNIDIYEG
jgi:hypothetical protein